MIVWSLVAPVARTASSGPVAMLVGTMFLALVLRTTVSLSAAILASIVVGGLTDRPVIAVPTSVGYGASFNGLAALLGMLNSCSSGVAVMNIDNGFGAAVFANAINEKILNGGKA